MTKLEAFCKGSAKQEALLYSQTLSLDITSLGLKSMTGMVREGFVVPKLLSVGVRLTLASGYAHVHFAHNCQTKSFSMLCPKPWTKVRAAAVCCFSKITSSHLRVLCLWPSLPSPDPRPPCCWSACSSHPFLSGTSVTSCIGGRYLEYVYQIPKPRSVWYQIPRSIWCQIPEVYDTKHQGNRHIWQQIPKGTWQQIPKSTWQQIARFMYLIQVCRRSSNFSKLLPFLNEVVLKSSSFLLPLGLFCLLKDLVLHFLRSNEWWEELQNN